MKRPWRTIYTWENGPSRLSVFHRSPLLLRVVSPRLSLSSFSRWTSEVLLSRAIVNRSSTRRLVGHENAANDLAIIEVNAIRHLGEERWGLRGRAMARVISELMSSELICIATLYIMESFVTFIFIFLDYSSKRLTFVPLRIHSGHFVGAKLSFLKEDSGNSVIPSRLRRLLV